MLSDTLNEILELDELALALIDTSVEGALVSGWYEEIYAERRFERVNVDLLRDVAAQLEDVMTVLRLPRVSTVERVAEECKRMDCIMREKVTYMNMVERKHRSTLPRHSRTPNGSSEGEFLMKGIAFLYNRIWREATFSLVKPASPKFYEAMSYMVEGIGEISHAKSNIDRPEMRSRKAVDLRADEQLVGAALCLSVTEDKQTSIVTADTDIFSLLIRSIDFLASVNSSSVESRFAQNVIEHLKTSPVRIYCITQHGRLKYRFDTSSYAPRPEKNRVPHDIGGRLLEETIRIAHIAVA